MATEEKRLVHQSFMTTEAEADVIRRKMDAFGIKKKSGFFRAMVLKGYLLKVEMPEIREWIRLLKNLTNNVNQIAKRLNEHGSIYMLEIDDIRQRLDELWETTNQMLNRLISTAEEEGYHD